MLDCADKLESWTIEILNTALNAGSSKQRKALLAEIASNCDDINHLLK